MRHTFTAAVIAVAFGLAACSDNPATPSTQTLSGPLITIGSGTAQSWAVLDASGQITTLGVKVTDAALASLGTEDTMFTLPLPTGVPTTQFKEVGLDYATHDEAPYDKPHLDAHFYLEDMMQRMNIGAGTDTTMPMNFMMPPNFMMMGESEAMMGVHWMDTTAPEMHGGPFEAAYVLGTSKGQLVFMEMMRDLQAMKDHKSYTKALTRPTKMGGMTNSMMFPATMSTSYDAPTKTTTYLLTGFGGM
jgi:hypothetical protein